MNSSEKFAADINNIASMNHYLREINRQRNQGLEGKFNKRSTNISPEEIRSLARAHSRWNRGTRKVRHANKVKVRLFKHNNEVGRGLKGENQTVRNKTGVVWRIPKHNRRAFNLTEPMMWELYESMEQNEPVAQRPLQNRLAERARSKNILKHLRNTRKLFINKNRDV